MWECVRNHISISFISKCDTRQHGILCCPGIVFLASCITSTKLGSHIIQISDFSVLLSTAGEESGN